MLNWYWLLHLLICTLLSKRHCRPNKGLVPDPLNGVPGAFPQAAQNFAPNMQQQQPAQFISRKPKISTLTSRASIQINRASQNQQGFNPNQQGFNPNQQGFNPNQQGFNPNQQGFNPNQQGFYQNQQGFNPNQQGFAPKPAGL